MKIGTISLYIAKKFLVKFLQVLLGFSLLIFFINLLDALDKVSANSAPFYAALLLAFLQIPTFLNEIVPSLVLIAAIANFYLLSSRSEITIMRNCGMSLWEIIAPVAVSALLLGVFWVTIFDPISIQMLKKFNSLEGRFVKNEMREVVAPQNGIWLKQTNVENPDEDLIIQAKKVYQESLEMANVTIWYFDENNQFYKKIDAKEMLMKKDFWLLKNVTLNEEDKLNKKIDSLSVPTNLEADFVMQKIVNNFQDVKLFSIFQLPSLIKDLSQAGFSSNKFKVYLHSLLGRPLLFLAMTLISCFFGLNHIRSQNSLGMIFLGIVTGLTLYITSSIITALGSSGLISVFASTWVIVAICLAIGTLLIYQKEHL
jgi:lipopolysaccharide export system permease protein